MKRAAVWQGHVCPVNPEHGPLLPSKDDPTVGWLCPNAEHNGRPKTHPLGALPESRRYFTTAEVTG